MCNDRSCFNCEYLHMGRCMNVRSKFFDDECEKVRICGAWMKKDKISAEDFIKAFGGQEK